MTASPKYDVSMMQSWCHLYKLVCHLEFRQWVFIEKGPFPSFFWLHVYAYSNSSAFTASTLLMHKHTKAQVDNGTEHCTLLKQEHKLGPTRLAFFFMWTLDMLWVGPIFRKS